MTVCRQGIWTEAKKDFLLIGTDESLIYVYLQCITT